MKIQGTFLFIALFFASIQIGNAQLGEVLTPILVENNINKSYAWWGGLNAPQFSSVDVDNDGVDDMIVFDKVGNKFLPLKVTTTVGGAVEYTYQRDWENLFPPVEDWVLFRDYNGDGIEDIFAYAYDQIASGVIVFTGYYNADGLISFERFHFPQNLLDMIYIDFPGSGPTQLYVSSLDYPHVGDVDCDGDLDILTFESNGGYLEFYQNQSVEEGYGLDSLLFDIEEFCWGGIYESWTSNDIILSDVAGDCATLGIEESLGERHAGSTVLAFDNDGDGDQDLLLGDVSYGDIKGLTNGGHCGEAWMTSQDYSFPSYNTSVDIPIFPASYYVDITGDGKRDLVVAPNDEKDAIDRNMVWTYRNDGEDNAPYFSLVQTDWLVGEMFDLGTGAHPAFLDYNADGLLDLVVGNYSYYTDGESRNSRLVLLENTGTPTEPAFEVVDEDFLEMSTFASDHYGFSPAVGDWDGDGDQDMVIGEYSGYLFWVENTAGVGNPMSFSTPVLDVDGVNVGAGPIPQLFDLNQDGLLDLLIGERKGNINYIENIGTANNPEFGTNPNVAPNNFFIGEVDTRAPGLSTGFSVPCFFKQPDGTHLITGSRGSQLEHYTDIDDNLDGVFTWIDDNFHLQKEGENTHPALADLDGDGLLEVVIGNQRGGLRFYETTLPYVAPPVSTNDIAQVQSCIGVSTSGNSTISIDLGREWSNSSVFVYGVMGELLYHQKNIVSSPIVNAEEWSSGIYFVQVVGQDGQFCTKKVFRE